MLRPTIMAIRARPRPPSAQGSPISGRLETATDVDFFKVDVTSSSTLFAATDSGRVGDPGYPTRYRRENRKLGLHLVEQRRLRLGVRRSRTAASAELYVRVSGSFATRYDVAVWLIDTNESDTSFDIELRYLGTEPTAAQRNTIRAAADDWEASSPAASRSVSSSTRAGNVRTTIRPPSGTTSTTFGSTSDWSVSTGSAGPWPSPDPARGGSADCRSSAT